MLCKGQIIVDLSAQVLKGFTTCTSRLSGPERGCGVSGAWHSLQQSSLILNIVLFQGALLEPEVLRSHVQKWNHSVHHIAIPPA